MPITIARPELAEDVVLVLDYLWGQAPVSQDECFDRVLWVVISWLSGEEDPFPDPPPDDKGHRPAPPPDPPPMPAYPIGQMLALLKAVEPATQGPKWDVVIAAFEAWVP